MILLAGIPFRAAVCMRAILYDVVVAKPAALLGVCRVLRITATSPFSSPMRLSDVNDAWDWQYHAKYDVN